LLQGVVATLDIANHQDHWLILLRSAPFRDS
jgi:hypothetical protein